VKAINFYKNFSDPKAAWSLSLNPHSDPSNAATAKAGWSVGDGDGNSKLFIDEATGNVGIGTTSPVARLAVNGVAGVQQRQRLRGAEQVHGTGLGDDRQHRCELRRRHTVERKHGGTVARDARQHGDRGVNDAGTRLASLLYYEGEGVNRVTIGRDMGWGPSRAGAAERQREHRPGPTAPTSPDIPAAVKGLYVTGDFGQDADGVEFRHSNGTQGIGFGFNTIYATGSSARAGSQPQDESRHRQHHGRRRGERRDTRRQLGSLFHEHQPPAHRIRQYAGFFRDRERDEL